MYAQGLCFLSKKRLLSKWGLVINNLESSTKTRQLLARKERNLVDGLELSISDLCKQLNYTVKMIVLSLFSILQQGPVGKLDLISKNTMQC
jgi:hypothetical protein